MTDEDIVMNKTAQIKQEWSMAIINLAMIGNAQGFMDENGEFELCVSTESDKISAKLKIEPTNIIKFTKQ
jgi:hypothetical protein